VTPEADGSAVGTSPEPAPAGAWLELAVVADLEAVEAVSEILGRYATGGTTVEPAYDLVDEGLGARIDPTRPATVRGYVPARDPASAELAATEAAEALGHLQAFGLRAISDLQTRIVHEEDWADAWKAYFPVLRIGRRLVIRPTWRRHRRVTGDVVVAMDPGMAFGTGLHPTTRLCLAALEAVADRDGLGNARVLDVGCGSGILSIAAVRLGASSALGVDIDPIAIEATAANARRNGLARRVRARIGSLPSGEPAFDVVLANLIAGVLVGLAGELRAELRSGGILVASGIFLDRESEVADTFETVGLEIVDRLVEGDWIALRARRSA
jgi:ribosomal protein L11 methyltransferase